MEFIEKINSLAKAAADKTSDVIDETRLKAQILNDEKSIKELETKLGAYYYKKFASGESVDEEVLKLCTAISVHIQNMKEKKAALNTERTVSPKTEADDPFEQS